MSAPVCSSRLACTLNGLRGTALFLVAVALGWALFDGSPVWLVLPGGLGAVLAARASGTLGLGLTVATCLWTVAVLNNWVPL